MISSIFLFDIIQLYQQYGVVVAVLVLAVLTAFYMIKNSTKRIKDQEEKIDSLYGRIDKLMTKFTHDEENNELTGKFISFAENASKIQIQLYHILQTFGADRVSIFEFHNGGKNLAGVEFKKCSNTYEAVELETKPIIKEMQNLPLSINPLWSRILATRTDIQIPVVANLEDTFLRAYLETQSIKTYYSRILLDYDNTPIGFISLEYYKNTKLLREQQLDEFNGIAIKISVLINLK
jgi:hypothetical protein